MSNVEDIKPVDCLATRVWGGTQWYYPHIERMVSEMKAMRKTIADHAAELARVEGERDAALKDFELLCSSSSDLVSANALLRAECEAWRHRYESKCPADAGTAAHTAYHTEAAKKLKEARAATDAAGVLKGVE